MTIHRTREISDVITKMALDKNRLLIPLLIFIKEHENDERVSREKVVKYMQKEDLSSRITTLNMINALLQEEILIDPKTKNYEPNLKINPHFDFYRLLVDSIYYEMEGMEKTLRSLKAFEHLVKNKIVKMDVKIDKGPEKIVLTVTP